MSMIVRRSSRRCGVLLLLVLAACTGPHDVVQVGIDAKGAPVNVGGAFTANVSFAQAPMVGPVEPVDVRLDWSEALVDRRRLESVTGSTYMVEHRAGMTPRWLDSFDIVDGRLMKTDFFDGSFAHDLRDSGVQYSIRVVVKAIDKAENVTWVVYESPPSMAPGRNVSRTTKHKLGLVNWRSDP